MTSSSPPAKRSRTNNNDDDTVALLRNNIHDEGNSAAKLKIPSSSNNTTIQLLNNVISSNIIDQPSTTELLATSYRNAKPYPHGMIYNFCKEGFLGKKRVYTTYAMRICFICACLVSSSNKGVLTHLSCCPSYTVYYTQYLPSVLFI